MKIFEGFCLATAKILTLLFICFSLIIHNVTFLPTIQNSNVIFWFVVVTMGLGSSIVYFSMRYSFTELDKVKEELAKE